MTTPLLLTAALLGSAAPALSGSWTLTHLSRGGVLQPVTAPAPTLTFSAGAAGNRLSGWAGCNTLSGQYAARGSALRVSKLATTRRFCPGDRMALERDFTALLNRATRYQVSAGRLTIYAKGQQRLVLTRTGGPVTTPPSQPTAPITAADLSGDWQISELQQGQGRAAVPQGSTLSLRASGSTLSLRGRAGCNQISGQATLIQLNRGQLNQGPPSGNTMLRFGPLGLTRMMCDNMLAEQMLTAVLEKPVSVSRDGERLIWQNDLGRVVLVRQNSGKTDPPAAETGPSLAALRGQTYQLRTVDGQPVTAEITLAFDGDQISGSDGCNRYLGSATVRAGRLQVPPLSTTLMACPDAPERPHIYSVLFSSPELSVSDKTLTLRGAQVWVFERR